MWKSGKKGTRGKWLAALESQTGAKVGNDVAFSLRIFILYFQNLRDAAKRVYANSTVSNDDGGGQGID